MNQSFYTNISEVEIMHRLSMYITSVYLNQGLYEAFIVDTNTIIDYQVYKFLIKINKNLRFNLEKVN